ncbi:adenylate/guanylate cyclase domain-containing protein [Kaustia mangrovi]|uniref:Adenylate/guanylate cyclase domain-containing protein n=1 Tax=Kaustia mangrovi TaxID=2593653 RepID=A0A7S8HB76_9HYPH|nr:adenylate/guanylate cyclase domain-containing protein [Kaustia mangrovi]QPC42209.1 adenylate/guanylate cyclase domain-containing protein [Kaustia mangrovi]
MAAQKPHRAALWARLAGIVAALLVIGVGILRPPILDGLTNALFDTYQRLRPRESAPVAIRIVDIDEESLNRLGQWPWPRDEIAIMVERLGALGAVAIGFDITFSKSDRTSPRLVLERLSHRNPQLDIRIPKGLPNHDRELAEAFTEWPVVAGFIMTGAPENKPTPPKAGLAFAGADPASYLVPFGGMVTNLPLLNEAASGLGFFNYRPDRDRIIRRAPVVALLDGQVYPSLATETLRVAQGASTLQVRSTGASGELGAGGKPAMIALRVGNFTVPTTAGGEMPIHYSTPKLDRLLPAWKLMTGTDDQIEALRPLIQDHIVLVGTSAPGLLDLVATPLSDSVPGVLVQAEIIDQIVSGAFLREPDWSVGAVVGLMFAISLALIVLLPIAGPAWSGLLGMAAVGGALAVSWLSFTEYGLMLSPVYPVLCALFVYLSMTAVLFLATERERRGIRSAFGLYLAPELVEQLADHPDQLSLGGEDRELTVLFCDIRSFTTLSEGLPPQELTGLINGFLTPMSEELLAGGATIDKYIGDAIMAFWNAPLPAENHAARACATALAMQRRLAEVNRSLGRDLHMGVGLNTGTCCVGNLGSRQRFNYSAVGDAVNLASRIEGLTKHYHVPILVGHDTATAAPGFAFLEIESIRVVGRHEPVTVHALLCGPDEVAADAIARLSETQQAMLCAYRAGEWARALDLVEEARRTAADVLPDQDLGALYDGYRDRIETLARDAPADWTGIVTAEEK